MLTVNQFAFSWLILDLIRLHVLYNQQPCSYAAYCDCDTLALVLFFFIFIIEWKQRRTEVGSEEEKEEEIEDRVRNTIDALNTPCLGILSQIIRNHVDSLVTEVRSYRYRCHWWPQVISCHYRDAYTIISRTQLLFCAGFVVSALLFRTGMSIVKKLHKQMGLKEKK